MGTIAALFDCDGTLYAAQYARGLMKFASDNGRKGAVWQLYAAVLGPLLLRRARLMSEERFHRARTAALALLVRGMREAEFHTASEWLNKQYLLPTERAEVVARLRDHQARGHAVLLVSAQLYPSLQSLGAHYGVANLVGTQVALKDGCYPGQIIPPVITGADKDREARAYFAAHGIEVDWAASYAYADSITDASMIGMVGHPVAVSPDPKLHALAQARGWEILGEVKPGL